MAETLLIVFVLFVVLGTPIALALGVGALGAALLYPALNPIIIPTRLVGLLSDSFLLLSAPLFILAGNIAARGGVARAIIDLATVLVGRFRGGLAYVNIVDSMLFGGISGSAVADVSALGTFLIPQMVRKGYDRDFATVLTICTAILAPIIPPSIIAVIYAWMADESVAAIFAGGYIPGLLIGLGMAVPTFVIARRRNYPREPAPTLAGFLAALRHALPGLMIPIIIMGGIVLGLFTPTEAAAVAVVYALVVPPLFYRELTWRDLPEIFADSARLSGVIGLIIGLVGAFGWVLTYSKFPFRMAAFITGIAPTWWLFLLVIIVFYVFLGTFLTPSEIILVTVPVLLPAAQALGVHPIHFGMVCVIASAIGHVTPPVGLCLFLGMAISGLPMEKLVRPLLPFLGAIVAVLLVVAFVPDTVLLLPRLLGFVK
ncbi:MAG TPA: TRAP transporter large permease [Methylomirabilota bacterium]|nr:TRAP transporter large permease [Methylomirabilota bacterium]